MTSIADVSVRIQTSSDSVPSTPCWFGEVALLIPYLCKQGILSAINSQVRLARRRFGRYEVIDFLAVLFGYAISGERTLEAFYEQLLPRKAEVILSRQQRAHSRLSWAERLARNARVPTAGQLMIRLFGVPEGFAISLGLATA